MAELASGPHKLASGPLKSDPGWLREDLGKEYYEVLGVVSNYDGWLLIVKGWSVTLSLAALGLGFQQKHYAFFGIAAVTGAAFWYLDGLMKGYQYRYYVRMREIEYTAWLINRVPLRGLYEENGISAPRIDMTWTFTASPSTRTAPNGSWANHGGNACSRAPNVGGGACSGVQGSLTRVTTIPPPSQALPTTVPANLGGGSRGRSTVLCGTVSGWRTSCFRTSSQSLLGCCC